MGKNSGRVRYRVEFISSARRQFLALPRPVIRRLDIRILALAYDPRPPGSKKLKGRENRYRLRVGEYRILYEIHGKRLLVLVVGIGHRREIYKRR